ncbi:hypothetical protein ACFC9R_02490 [Enterococcus casseliflavus]|uniref:hypothetical protein n=1 Tax=Enterococcus gallinarum TaxID=1353 RepID=UPI0013770430|nr:hypothetical protein [Enterococcus gallinarum]NCE17239.1 hypothetical protein [Enterococcus gallinarum]
MKHITEEGYKNTLKLLNEAINSIDENNLSIAKIRINHAIGILEANKDTKPKKKKKVWSDEWW